jgi:PAS domain S-box-containing protein
MTTETRVSAADLVRNFGFWQEKAINGPVFITHHRRDRLVLLSIDQYNSVGATAVPGSNNETARAQFSGPADDAVTELSAIIENINDAYLLLDPDETILRVNSRLEALWMVSRDQLVGRKVQDFLPAQRSSLILQKIRRVLLTREPETIEYRSQSPVSVYLSTRLWPHAHGVLLLTTNITELTHLRQNSAEAESLIGAIDRHPQVSHVQIDAKGRFTYSDETIQVWTGFDADTLANTRISDICAPDDRRRVMEAVEDVISAHVPSALTARFLGRNFSEHAVHLTLAPIMSDQNATALTVVAALVSNNPNSAVPAGALDI